MNRIAESAFASDYEIESIVLSDTVKVIEARAFLCTYKLKSINLKNVEAIEDNAFRGSGLSNMTLPVTIKKLGKEVFYYSHICN